LICTTNTARERREILLKPFYGMGNRVGTDELRVVMDSHGKDRLEPRSTEALRSVPHRRKREIRMCATGRPCGPCKACRPSPAETMAVSS
jgi:hypothetical protein